MSELAVWDITGSSPSTLRAAGVDRGADIATCNPALSTTRTYRKVLIDTRISAHNGRIVKTAGDGMLAQFASVADAARRLVRVRGLR